MFVGVIYVPVLKRGETITIRSKIVAARRFFFFFVGSRCSRSLKTSTWLPRTNNRMHQTVLKAVFNQTNIERLTELKKKFFITVM